jgi:hypothetical protein
MTLYGIDVSAFQTTTPPLDGLSFAFARAGFGSGNPPDGMYAEHAHNIRAAGLALGSYWFWYYGQDNASAVAQFLSVAGAADMLALDLEGINHGTSEALAEAKDFISRVHAEGRKIGLYGSASGFPDVGQDWNWIAQWSGTAPSLPWTFWQYTDTYQGASSGGDSDKFNGDAAALTAFVADQGDTVVVITKVPASGTFKVTAGKTAHALQLGTDGFVKTGAMTTTGSGSYDAHLSSPVVPTSVLHISAGLWAGFYVSTAEVDETPTAAPVAITQTQEDAAILAGKQSQYDLDAKSIAITQGVATAKLANARPS